jgi:carbon monoxide dehydrogenase subunit G
MRLSRSGAFEVEGSYNAAFDRLADAETVAACLPSEVRDVESRADGDVDLTVETGVGPAVEELRLRFAVERADAEAGRVEYVGRGLGSRTKVDLDGAVDVEDAGDALRVEWEGRVDLGGILSSLNRGIAREVAGEKVEETAENLRAALASAE